MTGWTAILPVKPWSLAKSRLRLGDDDRRRMARAFSLDVLDVLLSSESVAKVIVVSAEVELGAIARRAGATVLVDRPLLSPGMLNRAVDAGRRYAYVGRDQKPIVVVPGDLPAMTVSVLDHALQRLGSHDRAYVPDSLGTGTTLLAAARPSLLVPSYGPWSARSHSTGGYATVIDVDPRCRRDVDTATDLAAARHLGAGPRTLDALRRARTPVG